MKYRAMVNSPDQDHNKYWSTLGVFDDFSEALKIIDEFRFDPHNELFTMRMTDEDYKIDTVGCHHDTLKGYTEHGTRGVYRAMRCYRCGTNFNGGWNKENNEQHN